MKQMVSNSLFILLILLSTLSHGQGGDPFAGLRFRMVKQQLEARGISNEDVLEAFRKVERHRFVLPIEEGQTISQPYIVAFMTEVLELKRSDKVLEIGTGSGYQAAILAELCDSVFTIEIFEKLGKKAASLLTNLGYGNIHTKIGDGYLGWPEHAPFDAILVTCAPEQVPLPLQYQLAEGGQMIIPVGKGQVQHLVLLTKKKGKITRENILPVRFVPMVNPEGNHY